MIDHAMRLVTAASWMQGRVAEATSLARRHCHAPHFSRSLEWLLFTALEFNADDMPSPAKSAPGSALSPQHSPERPRRGSTAGSLLLAAAALIRTFPQVPLTACNSALLSAWQHASGISSIPELALDCLRLGPGESVQAYIAHSALMRLGAK